MIFTKNEKKLVEMYKDLPDVGMHGRALKYSTDERLMNPESYAVYYFILNENARQQSPEEFISRFKMTVSANFNYALTDLDHSQFEDLKNGKIEVENLPTLTYFTNSFENKFILHTEKTDISFGSSYYNINERSFIFDEGAAYLGVPIGAVLSKVEFDESDIEELKSGYSGSRAGIVEMGGFGYLPTVEKKFYKKSLETLINSFE